jgi:hypothetical protein|tara:strand:+ start:313 stop:453 length:141 start_codon:yes stop_codon:yes gene_type:complete
MFEDLINEYEDIKEVLKEEGISINTDLLNKESLDSNYIGENPEGVY